MTTKPTTFMQTPFLSILAACAALALAIPAGAEECVPTTSDPEVDVDTGVWGRYYVDNDLCQPECLFSVWVYQETNGIDGLQRGDEVKDDTCGGMIESDVLPGY